MLRNYVKIALRTLWKQKGITAINVLGLAAGMAVCLLVGLLFWDQVTHDDFHPGADRLYRVTIDVENGQDHAATPIDLAPALRNQVTGVETATRLKRTWQNVAVENRGFEAQGYYAEPSFFEVFGFELTAGSEEDALGAPYSAVISQQLARRLYGEDDPMGRTFHLGSDGPFTVTGVMNRDSYRSHLTFDVLYSFASIGTDDQSLRTEYTYLRLRSGYTPEDVAPSLQPVEAQHLPDESRFLGDARPDHFRLQSLSDIPLSGTTSLMHDNARGIVPPIVAYFLVALAVLVLLGAGFNYVNLSTARSLTRAREVGVRKTIGAHRKQVMGQFVAEGVLVSLLALGLAIVFLEALVPMFNRLSVVREMGVPIEIEPGLLLYGAFLLFALLVGLVAGLYPAWHLSKFQPAAVVKTDVQADTPGLSYMTPRKVLIVLQFAVAFVIIVSAALVYKQAHHVAEGHEYPFHLDDVIRVRLQDASYEPFQQAARQSPKIQHVGAASVIPTGAGAHPYTVRSEFLPDSTSATYYSLDYEAIQLLKLPFVAKHGFSEARFETGRAVLIDETAVQHFGFVSVQEALGRSITLAHSRFGEEWNVQIVGVVQNFAVRAFGERQGPDPEVDPVIFHYNPDLFREALAQVEEGEEQAALDALKAVWGKLDEANLFNGGYAKDYLWEREGAPLMAVGRLLGLVAALAVLISCLGLLGIATYTVQTRTREVGIRKALGATVTSIVSLLSRDFLWLIGAAILLGVPAAWWINRLWLQSFAYRIELGVWTFTLSAVGLLALALLAIGSQTFRAARTDPAQTLRDE